MKKIVAVILTLLLCISCVNAEKESSGYSVEINAAARILRLSYNGELVKEYPVAVGKPSTKSPLGSFVIRNKTMNPYWHNHGNIVPPGPKNPLGVRWMGISAPRGTYGIHGNSVPSSIGTFISGGCIRMYNSDVEELYTIVNVGVPVLLKYECVEQKLDKYTNSPVLILYPDMYKQKNGVSLIKKIAEVNKKISEEQKTRAMKLAGQNITNPIAVCQGTAIFLNNQFKTNAAYLDQNQVYVDYMAAVELLGLDGDKITALSIPTMQKEEKNYVNLSKAAASMGGELKFDKTNNNAYLSLSLVKLNGKYLYSYKGGFDREYEADITAFKNTALYRIEQQSIKGLKELCKQRGWTMKVDSLSKIIDIHVPLRLKVKDGFIETTEYKGRFYIDADQAAAITDLQTDKLKVYEYQGKKYFDVNDIMETHECQGDDYFTTIEVLKPLNSQV